MIKRNFHNTVEEPSTSLWTCHCGYELALLSDHASE